MKGRLLRVAYIVILCVVLLYTPAPSQGATVEELQESLDSKKAALKDIDEKIAAFQQKVQEKRRTAQTLKDQIEIISDNIENTNLSLSRTQAQIDETDAEVESVQFDIEKKEASIDKGKILLGEYIRQLQELDMQSTVAIFLKYSSLSEAIADASTVEELQSQAHRTIVSIQKEKQELLEQKKELDDFKKSLSGLKAKQQLQRDTLKSQNDSKEEVLRATNAQESEYQKLLAQAKADAQAAEAAISALDGRIREELRARGIGNLGSVGTMDWPIEPIFGISCAFHCGGYPYEYLIGPHTGTDIPSPVGTPIKAPADGYVGRTHDSGGRGYSYILLVHGDNLSTVYGHVSGFATQEGKLVRRGDVIGYTGGAAGARGSGLSSGPHLHFEVRKNNVAVNGLNYLKAR